VLEELFAKDAYHVAQVSVLVIGRLSDEEQRALVAPAGVTLEVACVERIDQAAGHLQLSGSPLELILIVEARGGECSTAAIDALRSVAPLARLWRIAGTWCEGEGRSGRPPAGCLVSYAHQWPARFGRELAALAAGLQPAWAWPLTASNEERMLALAERPLARRSGQVVISARSTPTAAALADACRLVGYEPLVIREDRPWSTPAAIAVLWDTDCYRMTDAIEVGRLRELAGAAPIVALAGFPRSDDIRRAREVGIQAVVSKPFLIHDLFWQLDEAIASGAVSQNR
jgi:CheY-like chemotaxis protein